MLTTRGQNVQTGFRARHPARWSDGPATAGCAGQATGYNGLAFVRRTEAGMIFDQGVTWLKHT